MSRLSANLLLLVAGLVWGLGFVAQETAMDDIGPFTFMTLRFALAALALLPLALFERARAANSNVIPRVDRQNLIAGGLVGALFFLAMAFQQTGLLATTVDAS